MDPKDFSMYDSVQVRVVPFPAAEAWGDGWWRVTWEVETTPGELPRAMHLPPPSRELDDLTLVVAVLPREPGQITVEVLSRHEKLIGEEIAYISLVMQAIRALYQEITVDGYHDHPILHMAKA
jgi:hypothetical protein